MFTGHIRSSRYISCFLSRNRGAMTLLQKIISVKKIASKEPGGKAGVLPVRGGQVRRGKQPVIRTGHERHGQEKRTETHVPILFAETAGFEPASPGGLTHFECAPL